MSCSRTLLRKTEGWHPSRTACPSRLSSGRTARVASAPGPWAYDVRRWVRPSRRPTCFSRKVAARATAVRGDSSPRQPAPRTGLMSSSTEHAVSAALGRPTTAGRGETPTEPRPEPRLARWVSIKVLKRGPAACRWVPVSRRPVPLAVRRSPTGRHPPVSIAVPVRRSHASHSRRPVSGSRAWGARVAGAGSPRSSRKPSGPMYPPGWGS